MKYFLKSTYKLSLLVIRILLSYAKYGFYLLQGKTRDKYCIKTNYLTRKNNVHFDDRSNTDQHQDEIYASAFKFFKNKSLRTVLDIGCGSGYKLIKYFSGYEVTGMELSPALEYLQEKYREYQWVRSDFNKPLSGQFDLVMAVDVIEHLKYPEQLINFLKRLNFKYVLLSTPDRSKMNLTANVGPPINKAHVREWNQDEFKSYISGSFNIIESKVLGFQDHYIIGEKY